MEQSRAPTAIAGRVTGRRPDEALSPTSLLARPALGLAVAGRVGFFQHGDPLQQAFQLPPIETDRLLIYRGMSNRLLSATQNVPLPSEEEGIDFEGKHASSPTWCQWACRVQLVARVRMLRITTDSLP
ncbi:hypothetical protein BH10PLA2_BH10PLA2_35650 [soil metagenome]